MEVILNEAIQGLGKAAKLIDAQPQMVRTRFSEPRAQRAASSGPSPDPTPRAASRRSASRRSAGSTEAVRNDVSPVPETALLATVVALTAPPGMLERKTSVPFR